MYIKEIYTLIHTPNDEIKKRERYFHLSHMFMLKHPVFFNAELSLVHTSAITFIALK